MQFSANIIDYVPLGAALIALAGVAITLVFSSRRERRASKVNREDAYRESMRNSLVELLVNAEDFYRHGSVLSKPEYWTTLGFERATQIADSTESSMRALHNSVISAQILNQDDQFSASLSSFNKAFDDAAEIIHEFTDAFWESRQAGSFAHEQRDERWQNFKSECDFLRELSRHTFRPTVREQGLFDRIFKN